MKRTYLMKMSALSVLLLATLIGGFAPVAAAAPVAGPYDAAVKTAADWILGQQQPDSSFPGFGVGSTADALFGLTAAARTPVAESGVLPLGFLAGKAKDYAKTPGAAAKLILAQVAAGPALELHNFGGVDLLKVITDSYDTASGHYGKDVTGQALVILALSATGQNVPGPALDWLVGAQATDGGWAFDGSKEAGKADTNTTGLVLQALAGHGSTRSSGGQALTYLHAQQNADGGFAYQKGPGADSDSNSTALVIMGLRAAGEDAAGASWRQSGKGPLDLLLSLQNPSGAFRYQASQADDNAGATYQALPALAGAVLPVRYSDYLANGQPTHLPGGSGGTANPYPGMPNTGGGADPVPVTLAILALALLAGGSRLRTRRVAR
ncbi:MAG: terpene cyclase/mutase family protein [Chloroflexota bacterium]|nr:terpene cyclase/mutase family protein [Chloroflexota bacterium]